MITSETLESPGRSLTLFHNQFMAAIEKVDSSIYELSDSLLILRSAIDNSLTIKSGLRELLQSFRTLHTTTSSSFDSLEEDDFI